MDSFFLKSPLLGAMLSLSPCLLLAQPEAAPQTISLEAQKTSMDLTSNKFAIEGVRISQGNLSIEADHALAGLAYGNAQHHRKDGDRDQQLNRGSTETPRLWTEPCLRRPVASSRTPRWST